MSQEEELVFGPTSGGDDRLLPEAGVKELADRVTEYMTRIEQFEVSDALAQVLDDFLAQCGEIPEELDDPGAFDKIVNAQLAVTLAFQLGRLTGKAPQLVEGLVNDAFEKFGVLELDRETEVTMEDFSQLTERVLPKLRRWRYYLDRETE